MSKPRSSANGGTPGRPRDAQIDGAVLAATLEVLDEKGYAALSLEEVAGRAGTSRPTIYRRWSGRTPLALAAIAARLDVPSPPDSGCTLCDLAESFNVFLAAYRTIRPDVLGSLYSDCARDPQLRDCFVQTLIEPSRRAAGQTLDRAIARGDLRAETDREQLLDILGSLVHYRALFGHEHLTDAEIESAIQTLLQGVAVDYPALLAHSQALELDHTDRHGDHHTHPATPPRTSP